MTNPDVVVIGAGPAGMAASVRAHESGASVLVIDENSGPGGQIWRGGSSNSWFRRFEAVKSFMSGPVIAAERDPLKLLVETEEGPREILPHRLIIASGAREIFLPFPGWTLPGVMGVGGLQAMAKSGLPVAGKKIVVAGSGPLLLAVAAYLRARGAGVKVIAEQASRAKVARFGLRLVREPGKLAQAAGLQLALRGVPYLQDCWVEQAEGDGKLRAVRLRQAEKRWTEDCDYAAVAYGLYPNTELGQLLGCEMAGTAVAVDELQRTSLPDVFAAGECTGIGGVDLSIVEGEIAGYAAAGRIEKARALFTRRKRAQAFAAALNSTFALRDELKGLPRADTIVCRCEDVTYSRLENVGSFRAAKLHTRCGMGPCQGRICGPAADFLFGWHTESIRPPIYPARLGTLAVWSGME
jgi:D-hydroxyproline dehydrogenase subunit alpha